jgi:hypothetical protein
MAFSIEADKVIDYPPEAIRSFYEYAFEWIDNLHFLLPAGKFLIDPAPYLHVAE